MNNKIFEIDFYVEATDYCEPIHFQNENECPICKKKFAGTDQYHSVQDCIDDEEGIFCCSSCDSVFKIHSYDYCNEPQAIIECTQDNFNK